MPNDLGKEVEEIDWKHPPEILKVEVDLYTGKANLYFQQNQGLDEKKSNEEVDLINFFVEARSQVSLDFGDSKIKYNQCECAGGSSFVRNEFEKKSLTTKFYRLLNH